METTATASWQLNGTTATYGTDDETLITIEGVTSTDGLGKPSGTTVKVSAASLDPDSTVTISEGYTLELGNDVDKAELSAAWDFISGTTADGTISAASDGYQVKDNQIQYFTTSSFYSTVTITGINETDGLSIDGNVITVSNASLNGVETMKVTSGNFKLALGTDVKVPNPTSQSWYYDNYTRTLNYSSEGRPSGYILENNVIRHVSEVAEENVTITGINTTITNDGASAEGIARNGNTFIISEQCLIKDEETVVRISGEGYYLALAEGIKEPESTDPDWYLDGTTATYKEASETEGFTLKDNKITYTPETNGKTLVSVYGVKSTDGLEPPDDDNIVAVYESALNGTNISISSGYSLELADKDLNPQNQTGWKLTDKRATYEVGIWTEGYRETPDRKEIEYSPAESGEVKVALNGVESKPSFVNDEESIGEEEDGKAGIVQLAAENFSEEGISLESNERGYSFKIVGGDYATDTKFFGSDDKDTVANDGSDLNIELGGDRDSIVNNGSNVFIDGGAGNDIINNEGGVGISVKGGAGNDNVTLGADSVEGGSNIFVYSAGEGKDKISGFGKSDKIQLEDNSSVAAEVKNDDVIFKVGSGTITIQKGATSNREIVIVNSEGSIISNNTYTHDGVISDMESGERQIVLASTFEGEYIASEEIKDTGKVTIVDASQVTKNVSLDGGAEGLSLIGGTGKDTLISGETDGFELKGGKGNDVFVYNGGNGRIKDYSQKGTYGKDKLVIGDGLPTLESFAISGDELTLNYGDGNELTLEGIKETTEITFGTKNSTIRTFKAEGMFDEKGKSATLASSNDYFKAQTNFSKLEMIDGSKTSGSTIIGNKKANYIIAGAGGSTLDGGKGKDTLEGGDGADVFVYDAKNGAGNKLIKNYGEGDKISLTSGASISEVKTKGDDLELKVGSNKITIEGGAGNSFKLAEDGNEKTFTADGLLVKGESASLTSSFVGNKVDMADYQDYSSINAGSLKKSFNIIGYNDTELLIGGKGNDTLTAGSSGSELWGGKGNDILIGSEAHTDIFNFYAGEGTDTIYSFNSGGTLDELWIYDKRGRESTYSKAVFSGSDDNGTLILSIKGGGKVLLEGISASETIKINGYDHTISGKKLN